MTRPLRSTFLALALAAGACAQGPVPAPGALALGWQGHLDTDLSLPGLLAGDHTLAGRFMLQYPTAGTAPIFASQGGTGAFSLVKADYAATRDVRLTLTYGNRMATFRFPKTPAVIMAEGQVAAKTAGIDVQDTAWAGAAGSKWFHVALVRSGSTVRLYLNGTRLAGLSGNLDASGNLSLAGLSSLPAGASTLRMGQFADAAEGSAAFFGQHYGLMDDVAAFDVAKDAAAVQSLSTHPQVDPNAADLVGLYNFNYNPSPIPAWVAHTPSYEGAAFRRSVSANGNSAQDVGSLLPPQHKTVFHLPFARGLSYQVMWGNGLNSHVGGAAFCWDFWRIGAGWDRDDAEAATNGARLYAAAAGRTMLAFDGGDAALSDAEKPKGNLIDGYNNLVLEHAKGEQTLYLHVKTGSINEAYSSNGFLFSPTVPNNGDKVANADWLKSMAFGVSDGQWITRIGTRDVNNYHLHFGSTYDSVAPAYDNTKTNVTFPLAFSDYEASDDGGQVWYHVARGIPKQGQWVRRPQIRLTLP